MIDPFFFSWRTVKNSGAWLYQENLTSGARRAIRIRGAGRQPIDAQLLGDGEVIG